MSATASRRAGIAFGGNAVSSLRQQRQPQVAQRLRLWYTDSQTNPLYSHHHLQSLASFALLAIVIFTILGSVLIDKTLTLWGKELAGCRELDYIPLKPTTLPEE